MYAHRMCVWCPQRIEEDVGSLETRVTDFVSCHVGGCWELNQRPLQEQQMLLTPVPSLQPYKKLLMH